MDNTWNFKEWFQVGVDSNISGLTSTKSQGANHLWRFERREHLPSHLQIECRHEGWQSWAPQNADVCMTVKQFISDKERSQMPELILPAKVWIELKESDLHPCHTNPFSERTLQEFRLTAEVVGRSPWNLLEGQHWLEELCAANEQRRVPDPVKLHFIFSLHGEELRFQDLQAQDVEIMNAEVEVPKPRGVRVAKAKAKRGFTHPAAAEAALRRPASVLRRSSDAAAGPGPPTAEPIESRADSNCEPEAAAAVASVPAGSHDGPGPAADSFQDDLGSVNQDDDSKRPQPANAVPRPPNTAADAGPGPTSSRMKRPAAAAAGLFKRPSSNVSDDPVPAAPEPMPATAD